MQRIAYIVVPDFQVMLFGGIFAAYTVYRLAYYKAFAEGSHELYFWLGTLNTVVLLTSSFFNGCFSRI